MGVNRHTLSREREIGRIAHQNEIWVLLRQLHIAWLTKGSREVLLLREQRQHPPSELPLKLSTKGLPLPWPCGEILVTLRQVPLPASHKESVLVPCENNDQVLPEAISQEVFLAKEKCSLSLCLGREIVKYIWPTPNVYYSTSQIFQNNESGLKILLCPRQ